MLVIKVFLFHQLKSIGVFLNPIQVVTNCLRNVLLEFILRLEYLFELFLQDLLHFIAVQESISQILLNEFVVATQRPSALVDELLKVQEPPVHLVIALLTATVLLEHNAPVLWQLLDCRQQHLCLVVQLRLLHEPVDALKLLNTTIVVRDDGNEEVKHNNQHEDDLTEPNDPNQRDVDRPENAWLFSEKSRDGWVSQLTNRSSECL